MSVCLRLKILVTTEPIGLYSLGNIPIVPMMVLGYLIKVWETPNPVKKIKNTPPPKYIFFVYFSSF